MHSVLLSSVHLRCASLQLSRWEKDWSSVSHRVKVSMDLRISSKMFGLEKCWKARKPSDRTSQHCYVIFFVVLTSFVMTATRNSPGDPS